MKRAIAFLAVTTLLLGASEVLAADATEITFSIEKGAYCMAHSGAPVVFLDSGADTATQSGSFDMECTVGTVPVVTVSGDGSGPGYDFSGRMVSGADEIAFTGSFTASPNGLGIGTPISWTFDATATGLLTAPLGSYSTTLTFTVNP